MPVRVWSVIDSGSRSRSSVICCWFSGLLSSFASCLSFTTSLFTIGRPSRSRSATTTVRSEMLSSELPMVLRSRARSAIQRWSSLTSVFSSWCRWSTVSRVWVRLLTTWPISSSRSARLLVSEAVLDSSSWMVPPSPCRTCTRFMLSSLTCFGSSAWNSGWKPLNSVVRSSAGVVWPTGMVAPASSRVPVSGRVRAAAVAADAVVDSVRYRVAGLVAGLEGEVAVADQVQEPDLGARGGRERHLGLHPERHQGLVALVVLDLPDLADADPRHPDVVALLEHRRVGEHRAVLGAVTEAEVAHDGGEQPGHQDRRDREDQQLDARGPRRSVASVADLGGLALGGHEPSPPLTTGP